MKYFAARDERDQASHPSGDKRQLGSHYPRAVQVHDPHIGAEGLFLGAQQCQKSNYNYCDEEQGKRRFESRHCTILPYGMSLLY